MARWKKAQKSKTLDKGASPYENAMLAIMLAFFKERAAKRPRIVLTDSAAAHSAATGLMKMRLISVLRQPKTGRMYCVFYKDYRHYTKQGYHVARVNRRGEWLFSARLRDTEGMPLEKQLYVPKTLYSEI